MSGICGIFCLDDSPFDRQLLERMTDGLVFRGPDARDTWADGPAGLGHTLLRTTFESKNERQPHTLDGLVWITADARIDAQPELKRKLQGQGRTGLAGTNDCELILHAYLAWGEDCAQHLLGDFAFAIWDGPRRRMFCARDHFGVKPLFYARVGQHIVVSNTLNCVRMHPAVSDQLHDLAIADFLLFEVSLDPASTAFADIRRLPPAHSLTCSVQSLAVKPYWSLPRDLGVRYRPAGDYVAHFTALLDQAVADRLRTDRVVIQMSGGLDSPAVAVAAKRLMDARSASFELRACTIVYDRLIPDQERRYAGLVAEHLGIPIDYFVADDYELYGSHAKRTTHFAEPVHNPDHAVFADSVARSATFSRVALTGWDGDALLNESPKPFFRSLWKKRHYVRLLVGIARYGLLQRRLVPLTARGWLRRAISGSSDIAPDFPPWINPALEKQFDLRNRWDAFQAESKPAHPLRPYAYRILEQVMQLSSFFDLYDPGITGEPIEYRHPFLDLRLIEYCLSLPPMPWCVKKSILRIAMNGCLPETVRQRPKTPMAGLPCFESLQRPDTRWVDDFTGAACIDRFVETANIPVNWLSSDSRAAWTNLRPLSLNFWLDSLSTEPTTAPSSQGPQ